MAEARSTVRVAALADVHCGSASRGAFQWLFTYVAEHADVLLICGDLTANGLSEEALVLAREITSAATIPIVAVLGNRDYHSDEVPALRSILAHAGVVVLDGEAVTIRGVGFAGVKGFAGGFGYGALASLGEPLVRQFANEAASEAVKLERALASLDATPRVALLHYSPCRATVEGEPADIIPFLGSSKFDGALASVPLAAVFHGHAHNGTLEGTTSGGVPVYNVALPLLRRCLPNTPPFRVSEFGVRPDSVNAGAPSAPGTGSDPDATSALDRR